MNYEEAEAYSKTTGKEVKRADPKDSDIFTYNKEFNVLMAKGRVPICVKDIYAKDWVKV